MLINRAVHGRASLSRSVAFFLHKSMSNFIEALSPQSLACNVRPVELLVTACRPGPPPIPGQPEACLYYAVDDTSQSVDPCGAWHQPRRNTDKTGGRPVMQPLCAPVPSISNPSLFYFTSEVHTPYPPSTRSKLVCLWKALASEKRTSTPNSSSSAIYWLKTKGPKTWKNRNKIKPN
jgi:hypothetical protein